ARTGGGPLFIPDGPARPIRDLLTASLSGTGHAMAVRRLPRLSWENTATWRRAAAEADLSPSAPRPLTICDLVAFGGPGSELSAEVHTWFTQQGYSLDGVLSLTIVPSPP